MTAVSEYGARVLRPDERLQLYAVRRGAQTEESLQREVRGIAVKQGWLQRLRMIPRHRSLVVLPKRRRRK